MDKKEGISSRDEGTADKESQDLLDSEHPETQDSEDNESKNDQEEETKEDQETEESEDESADDLGESDEEDKEDSDEEDSEEESEDEDGEENQEETPDTEQDQDKDQDPEKAEYQIRKQEQHAARKIQELAEENKRLKRQTEEFEADQEMYVRQDVNRLYGIAKSNPQLADKLVKKVFGATHGVETFEELKIVSDKARASEDQKPLYDKLLQQERELRSIRAVQTAQEEEKKESQLKEFEQKNTDFKGLIKSKTLEIVEKSGGAYSLEEAIKMARGLVMADKPELLRKEGERRARLQASASKAGIRKGSGNSVKFGGSKKLTPAQIEMAKKFRNDPTKVY